MCTEKLEPKKKPVQQSTLLLSELWERNALLLQTG